MFCQYNHYSQVHQLFFASELGFNIHQMCFAWCQKTKRSLERKEVLVNLKSVYKKVVTF